MEHSELDGDRSKTTRDDVFGGPEDRGGANAGSVPQSKFSARHGITNAEVYIIPGDNDVGVNATNTSVHS
jgi:hypothetical protein